MRAACLHSTRIARALPCRPLSLDQLAMAESPSKRAKLRPMISANGLAGHSAAPSYYVTGLQLTDHTLLYLKHI